MTFKKFRERIAAKLGNFIMTKDKEDETRICRFPSGTMFTIRFDIRKGIFVTLTFANGKEFYADEIPTMHQALEMLYMALTGDESAGVHPDFLDQLLWHSDKPSDDTGWKPPLGLRFVSEDDFDKALTAVRLNFLEFGVAHTANVQDETVKVRGFSCRKKTYEFYHGLEINLYDYFGDHYEDETDDYDFYFDDDETVCDYDGEEDQYSDDENDYPYDDYEDFDPFVFEEYDELDHEMIEEYSEEDVNLDDFGLSTEEYWELMQGDPDMLFYMNEDFPLITTEQVAGYLFYCLKNNTLDKAIDDWVKNHFKPSGQYKGKTPWLPANELRDSSWEAAVRPYQGMNISASDFDLAEWLADCGYVNVKQEDKDGSSLKIFFVDGEETWKKAGRSSNDYMTNVDLIGLLWKKTPASPDLVFTSWQYSTNETLIPYGGRYVGRWTEIFIIAAYIRDLKDNGEDDVVSFWRKSCTYLSTRSFYDKEYIREELGEKFQFLSWQDIMYKKAEALIRKNFVSVLGVVEGEDIIDEDGDFLGRGEDRFVIRYDAAAEELVHKDDLIDICENGRSLSLGIVKDIVIEMTEPYPNNLDDTRGREELRLIMLAGYLDYLGKLGRLEEFYKEVEAQNEDIEWLLKVSDAEDINALYPAKSEHTGKRLSGWRKYEEDKRSRVEEHIRNANKFLEIPGFPSILNTIRTQDSLNCCLFCGNDEDYQKWIKPLASMIAGLLCHMGKANDANYLDKTFGRVNEDMSIYEEKNGSQLPLATKRLIVLHSPRKHQLSMDDISYLKKELSQERNDRYVILALNAKEMKLLRKEAPKIYTLFDIAQQKDAALPKEIQGIRKKLDDLIGMENVKLTLRKLENYINFLNEAKEMGAEISSGNLHMMFTGNPGTGKTKIAYIIAEWLSEMGIIQKDDNGKPKYVEVERKDLVGDVIGATEQKTNSVINDALDGVLFIDEAYTLYSTSSRDFGSQAIAALLTAMEKYKDRLIVIFAGYRKEMHAFKHANPGLASRIGYTFDFADYTPSQLTEMLERRIKGMNLSITKSARAQATTVFEHYSKTKDFGNGRFVEHMAQEILMKHANSSLDPNNRNNYLTVTENDIPDLRELGALTTPAQESVSIDKIIGMDSIKEQIVKLEKRGSYFIKARKSERLHLSTGNMHMLFMGNPGTGKTMIARIIAQKLYEIGVIVENKVIEVERKDLVGEHVGKTAPKTNDAIERAMGGVLFIDEAYTLTPRYENDFSHEAIATLIKAMEDHKDNLVVIFAGYYNEMQRFVDANAGIASRIGFTFHFPDYNAKELTEIFVRKMEKIGYIIGEGVKEKVQKIMQFFSSTENFGNGRFADRIVDMTITRMAELDETEDADNIEDWTEFCTVTEQAIPDIPEVIRNMSNSNAFVNPENITDEDLKRTAVHEIGHAVVMHVLFPEKSIKKITIVAEGRALGYVSREVSTEVHSTRTHYENMMAVATAGLASEKCLLGEFGTGGSSDMQMAFWYARNLIRSFGMHSGNLPGLYSEQEINAEVNDLVGDAFKHAEKLITKYTEPVKKAVELLIQKKEMTHDELKQIMDEFDNK